MTQDDDIPIESLKQMATVKLSFGILNETLNSLPQFFNVIKNGSLQPMALSDTTEGRYIINNSTLTESKGIEIFLDLATVALLTIAATAAGRTITFEKKPHIEKFMANFTQIDDTVDDKMKMNEAESKIAPEEGETKKKAKPSFLSKLNNSDDSSSEEEDS